LSCFLTSNLIQYNTIQRVATLQLGSNCCNFITIFAALSSAAQKCERAFKQTKKILKIYNTHSVKSYYGL